MSAIFYLLSVYAIKYIDIGQNQIQKRIILNASLQERETDI